MKEGKRSVMRSETEKEKTKIRERQRRSITTNIFHGLRKHGGYRLSPRADINELLRHLAKEAGWFVDLDGTTYRSPTLSLNRCSVCGTVRSTTPTPTSSVVVAGGGDGGGESSTPVSGRDYNAIVTPFNGDIPLAVYVYGTEDGHGCFSGSAAVRVCGSGGGSNDAAYEEEELQEARASNQSTPEGSP